MGVWHSRLIAALVSLSALSLGGDPAVAARKAAPSGAQARASRPAQPTAPSKPAAPKPLARPAVPDREPIRVILDLQSSFLQGVPRANVEKLDRTLLVEADGKHFGVAPHTGKALARLLADPRVSLIVRTALPTELARKILDSIPLDGSGKSLGASVAKVVTDAPEAVIEQECPPARRCVLISDDAATLPEKALSSSFLLRTGPSYFHFDSYEQVRQGEEAAKGNPERYETIRQFFPPSEAAWKHHRSRMAGAFWTLEQALDRSRNGKASFTEAMGDSLKTTDSGERVLRELSRVFRWKIVDKAVKGCVSQNPDGSEARDATLELCRGTLKTKLAWHDGAQCALVTFEEDALVAPQPTDSCVASFKTYHFWADRELRRCGLFTESGAWIREAPKEKCGIAVVCDPQTHVLSSFTRNTIDELVFKTLKNVEEAEALECEQPSGPIKATDSPNYAYFKGLAERGVSAPLQDFLKLWYPAHGDGNDQEAYFLACQSEAWGAIKPGADGLLTPQCSPDVLYSWGPPAKLATIRTMVPDKGTWSGRLNQAPTRSGKYAVLYATISALATYPYGPTPVRIKMKRGTPVRQVADVSGEAGAVTYYPWSSGWGVGHDFYLADASVVESWSHSTPEHYDEIVRDALRISSGRPGIAYVGTPSGSGLQRVIDLPALDGFRGGEAVLKQTLLGMIQAILAEKGEIFYSAGSCRNRMRHFETEKPSYLNPRARSR